MTKVLDAGDHMLDGRKVDVKKAIPHAVHQVHCANKPPNRFLNAPLEHLGSLYLFASIIFG